VVGAIVSTRRTAVWVLVCTAAVGWGLAAGVEISGHADAFHHHMLLEGGQSLGGALLTFVLAWQVMVAAMMLPSTLPMVELFAAASSRETHPRRTIAAFLAGYAVVWMAFGVVALLGDAALHRIVDDTPALDARPWLVTGALLVVAGVAQFLPLTQACLRSCRHPFAYLLEHYRPTALGGFSVGSNHGLYCLGCCWALMLVMFALGVANLIVMATLTGVMVYEKTGRHGTRLAGMVGIALIGLGVVVLLHPGWLPAALRGVE